LGFSLALFLLNFLPLFLVYVVVADADQACRDGVGRCLGKPLRKLNVSRGGCSSFTKLAGFVKLKSDSRALELARASRIWSNSTVGYRS